MSIYSGFATRQQEEAYDQLVEDVLFVFQKRIMKFYRREDTNEEKFLDVLVQLHQQMARMEESKYLEPKNSKSIEELLRFLILNAGKGEDREQSKGGNLIGGRAQIDNKNTGVQSTNAILAKNHNYLDRLRNEPHSSVGKIVHQLRTNQDNNSLANSRNTFINRPEAQAPNSQDNQPQLILANPEDHPVQARREANKSRSRFASNYEPNKTHFSSIGADEKSSKRNEILEYLEKQNKNYLRGYRKRSVKSRNYSKELGELLGTGRKPKY